VLRQPEKAVAVTVVAVTVVAVALWQPEQRLRQSR
jgi:hypothetical protein